MELRNSTKKKQHVLLVDDIPSNLNFLSEVIHAEGIGILIATNGKEALEIARTKPIDLILLDIAMPEMDGYEVCAELKKDPITRNISVIFLTARTEPEDIVHGFETGAVDYILKPFNAAELIARVKIHLELIEKSEELRTLNNYLEEEVRKRTAELSDSNKNLVETNKKLEKAYDELSKLDKAKNEFIRHINHELRTPLQGIHGFTLILEEIVESSEEKEYIKSINTLVKRLVKLSELTLLFTEIKASNFKPELVPVDLKCCIEQVIGLFEDDREKISVMYDNASGMEINADQKLFCICLELILENALKYIPEKGKVIIKLSQNHPEKIIEISDNGPGFSTKALEGLFEIFSADNLEYRSHGFGIGLATAKSILDSFSAKLEINNLPFQGATIKMIFQ